MDESHTGAAICQHIFSVLQEYSIAGRIIALTMDNTSYNKTAIDDLRKKLQPQADGILLHQKYAAHIINLMVQAGLRTVGPSVEAIRLAIKTGNYPNTRVDRWKVYCKSHNLDERVMATDYEGRWNSTFIMLDRMLPYKEVFTNWIHGELRGEFLTDEHWSDAEAAHKFLKVFFDATNTLSASETPTSLNAMHKLYEMSKVLKAYEDHETLGTAVANMKEVWKKYFFPMPKLYEYAFILDPRIRLPTLRNMYILLDRMLDLGYVDSFDEAESSILTAYRAYELEYHRPPPQETRRFPQSPVKTSWTDLDRLREENNPDSPTLNWTPPESNELKMYLNATFNDIASNNLDLLHWWKVHESTYPILAIFARDVVTVPVSSVSSKQTFSQAGLLISDRRARMKPKIIKILTCLKDWQRAKLKMPTEMSEDTNEWINYFQDFSINDPSPQNE